MVLTRVTLLVLATLAILIWIAFLGLMTVRLPVTSGSSSAPALFVSKSMLHSQGYGNASNEDALANTMIQLRQLPQPSPREDAYEEPAAAHDCLEFDLTDAGFSSEQSLWEEQRLLGINKTVNGTLEADEYHFFHLCIIKHTHHHEITIQAISITGDTDVYCSTDIVRPRAEKSTWLSAHIGTDVITLKTDHPDWNALSNAMYIGLHARHKSTYSLIVTLKAVPPRKRLRGIAPDDP